MGLTAALAPKALRLRHRTTLARDGSIEVDDRDSCLGHDRLSLIIERFLDVVDGQVAEVGACDGKEQLGLGKSRGCLQALDNLLQAAPQ